MAVKSERRCIWYAVKAMPDCEKAGQLILKALLFTVKLAYSELIRQSTKKWFEDFFQ